MYKRLGYSRTSSSHRVILNFKWLHIYIQRGHCFSLNKKHEEENFKLSTKKNTCKLVSMRPLIFLNFYPVLICFYEPKTFHIYSENFTCRKCLTVSLNARFLFKLFSSKLVRSWEKLARRFAAWSTINFATIKLYVEVTNFFYDNAHVHFALRFFDRHRMVVMFTMKILSS